MALCEGGTRNGRGRGIAETTLGSESSDGGAHQSWSVWTRPTRIDCRIDGVRLPLHAQTGEATSSSDQSMMMFASRQDELELEKVLELFWAKMLCRSGGGGGGGRGLWLWLRSPMV